MKKTFIFLFVVLLVTTTAVIIHKVNKKFDTSGVTEILETCGLYELLEPWKGMDMGILSVKPKTNSYPGLEREEVVEYHIEFKYDAKECEEELRGNCLKIDIKIDTERSKVEKALIVYEKEWGLKIYIMGYPHEFEGQQEEGDAEKIREFALCAYSRFLEAKVFKEL